MPALKGEEDINETVSRDQLVYEYFSKRFDELFHEKSKAESKVMNFMTEVWMKWNVFQLLFKFFLISSANH